MFLPYFNLVLVILLILGLGGVYVIIFTSNLFNFINFITNNNEKIILCGNADNTKISTLFLNSYSDFLLLNNLNIQKYIVDETKHLKEIPIYENTELDSYSKYYKFYNAATNSENILLGINKFIQIENPFLYYSGSAIAIILNYEDTYFCFLGSTMSNETDVLSIILYVVNNYSKFVITGIINFEYTTTSIYKTLYSFYSMITNRKFIENTKYILSYDVNNYGVLFKVNQ